MLDIIISVFVIVLFTAGLWGSYLTVQDKQNDYDDKINYDKMKREVDKNDSSRIG
jgi:hypothetical protein